mmetsp:Transcript_17280/g.14736  ORF Transcript_17280/g.14736 Transcript_17280/m.14736 type:complete len:152 (+) Transcript_17280:40-495(+)
MTICYPTVSNFILMLVLLAPEKAHSLTYGGYLHNRDYPGQNLTILSPENNSTYMFLSGGPCVILPTTPKYSKDSVYFPFTWKSDEERRSFIKMMNHRNVSYFKVRDDGLHFCDFTLDDRYGALDSGEGWVLGLGVLDHETAAEMYTDMKCE